MTLISSVHAAELQSAKAEKVGVSSQRLERLNSLAQSYVDEGQYSGIVTMVARKGKVIHLGAAGNYGIDNDKPMSADTLFRIYSMTKPITAVATMMLFEQGAFHIDDPVDKYLPEFTQQKILRDGELHKPKSPMTIRQLLTHTAGLTYGWTEQPVDLLYLQAKPFESTDLAKFVQKIADLPLLYEPGTRYHYSVAYDVLGALIERISGMPLDQYFEKNIFKPLGMIDTFFEVPADQMHRLASDQIWDSKNKKIAVVPAKGARRFDNVKLFIGGGGLVSTIGDYMRFCQMILNGGSFAGAQLLGPKTVAFLGLDHLTPDVRAEGVGEFPVLDLYKGQSMALGYGVVTNPEWMPDLASKGELSWGGVAGTKFWIDPQEQLIAIGMVQLYQSPTKLRFDLKSAIYPALEELY